MHFLHHRSLPRGRFVAVVAAVLLAMACERRIEAPAPVVTSEEPRRGGTAVIGSGADIGGVNELTSSHSTFSRSILEKLFLHLLEEQPDYALHPPTFAPQLAASYEWSEDHLVLTLHLRPEVVWSDGVPVTAEDVRWTWQAQIDPELAWEYAQVKESIVDMEVVDSHTLKVFFKQATASQLTDLNEGVILPRHVWSRLPASEWNERAEWFTENLVVSGPFTLESWSPQSEIVLERNESFYKPEQPYLDRVVFRIVPEKSNRILQLLAGDLDLVEQIPPAEAARIRDDETLELLEFWHRQYDFISWNLGNPALCRRRDPSGTHHGDRSAVDHRCPAVRPRADRHLPHHLDSVGPRSRARALALRSRRSQRAAWPARDGGMRTETGFWTVTANLSASSCPQTPTAESGSTPR